MPKIIVDGIEYEVKDKKNLLDACLSLKLDLPYFCWHPAMNSVGACRQCAVTKYKDENDYKEKVAKLQKDERYAELTSQLNEIRVDNSSTRLIPKW